VIFAIVVEASGFSEAMRASRYLSPLSAAAVPTLRTSSASACSRVQRAIISDWSLLRRANDQDLCHCRWHRRPLAFCLNPCNVADIIIVLSVLANTILSRQFFDQVYDARAFRQRLAERAALVVRRPNSTQRTDPATEINARAALPGISICRSGLRRAGDRAAPCNSSPP
jgi:hypothetical protein